MNNTNFQDFSNIDANNQRYQTTFNIIPSNSEEMSNLSLKKINKNQNYLNNFNFFDSSKKNRNVSSIEVNKNLFS